MKLALIVGLCLVGFVVADDYITELCKAKYVSYKKTRTAADYPAQFLASYGASVDQIREQTFLNNCRDIELHNRKKDKSYFKAINQFTDWTQEEFLSLLKTRAPAERPNVPVAPLSVGKPVVGDTDLRKKGVVNSVRNQGQCGSCWAFGATAAFEINHAIKYGHTEGSEQFLVDCDTESQGCNGGWYTTAWDMVINDHNGQFPARNGYDSYKARQGRCHGATSNAGTISKYYQAGSESQMTNNVDTYGAIAVAVDASDWSSYGGGLYNGWCSGQINHAVVVIGYGSEGGRPYWIIRNSWGSGWGESGYIRLPRGRNMCSVADYAYIPVSDRA